MAHKMNKKGFASLLGMLLAVGIVCFLVYIMLKTYFKPFLVERDTDKTQSGQTNMGITSYKTFTDSAREKVKEINKRNLEQANQFEELNK
jgi:type IV secretory pathway TrbF-like protein